MSPMVLLIYNKAVSKHLYASMRLRVTRELKLDSTRCAQAAPLLMIWSSWERTMSCNSTLNRSRALLSVKSRSKVCCCLLTAMSQH